MLDISMHITLSEGTFESVASGVGSDTVTTVDVVLPFTVVLSATEAGWVGHNTSSSALVSDVVSSVDSSVNESELSLSLHEVVLEVTFVGSLSLEDEFALSFLLSVDEVSSERGTIEECDDTGSAELVHLEWSVVSESLAHEGSLALELVLDEVTSVHVSVGFDFHTHTGDLVLEESTSVKLSLGGDELTFSLSHGTSELTSVGVSVLVLDYWGVDHVGGEGALLSEGGAGDVGLLWWRSLVVLGAVHRFVCVLVLGVGASLDLGVDLEVVIESVWVLGVDSNLGVKVVVLLDVGVSRDSSWVFDGWVLGKTGDWWVELGFALLSLSWSGDMRVAINSGSEVVSGFEESEGGFDLWCIWVHLLYPCAS